MFPLPLFYYFEIGAFAVSIIFIKNIRDKPLRWFIPYLLLMICTELTGRYISKGLGQPNSWLFNISIPVEYLFYGILIGSLCLTKIYKKIIFFLSVLFGMFVLINLFFIQGLIDLNTYTLKTGSCMMIFFSGLGLVDLFKNDAHETLLRNPLFWICTGILFFNTGEFLYLFFLDIFILNKWDQAAKIFKSINNKLIYVLYTCISISIVCLKKSEKRA